MKSSIAVAFLVVSLTSVAGAGCASSGTGAGLHIVANPAARFGAYRTFSFGPPEGAPPGFQMTARSAEVQRRLRGLVEAVLAEKGYQPASTGPGDVIVELGAAQREVESRDDGSINAEWLAADTTVDTIQGRLAVDLFDPSLKARVWHGSSRETIDPEHIDAQRLQAYVRELLASLPPVAAGKISQAVREILPARSLLADERS
jgi:hypothetical protein